MKAVWFAGLVLLSVVMPLIAQENCNTISWIPAVPFTVTGNTFGRVNDFNTAASCAAGQSSNAPDVIYGLIAPANGNYTIGTCGSLFNTVLEVRTGGACPGSVQLACNDNACAPSASEVTVSLLSGQTYYIIVDGQGNSAGTYTLSLAGAASCAFSTLNAPGTVSGNTCGAGDNSAFAPGEDQTIQVIIPAADDWSFVTCTGIGWAKSLFLTSACGDTHSLIASAADGCGVFGGGDFAILRAYLTPGTYYLTVEPYNTDWEPCGEYTLDVHPSRGRCCYSVAITFLCTDGISPTDCAALSSYYRYTEDGTCSDSCPVLPYCTAHPQFTQLPYLPGDSWWDLASETVQGSVLFENFSSLPSGEVGSVRFWGLQRYASWGDCQEDPFAVHVAFYTDNAGFPGALQCEYDLLLESRRIDDYYSDPTGPIAGWLFSGLLDPPCSLSSGWVSVAGAGDPDCVLHWLSSPDGDNRFVRGSPGNYEAFSGNLSFCLGGRCDPQDSLAMQILDDETLRLIFPVSADGVFNLYRTTDPAAVYPNGWNLVGQVAVGSGFNVVELPAPADAYSAYLVHQECDGMGMIMRDATRVPRLVARPLQSAMPANR